ncbi:TRAP transporter small permease subunit [Chloroflexota bacterium]
MKVLNIFDRVTGVLASGAAALIVLLMLGICADVIFRYFFNNPIDWMGEISGYFLVGVAFLGTAWGLGQNAHVSMDILVDKLKPRAQVYLNIFTSIIGALACLCAVCFGVQATWSWYQSGYISPTIHGFPLTPVVAIIPVGFILLFLQFIRRAYDYHRSWEKSQGQLQESKIKS